ncbi:MAG: glycosyltransferase family protein [Parcubacteria group bacterium]
MVEINSKNKVVILIAVRMKSARLPKKAVVKIESKSAIEHLLDRLKLAKIPKAIVICTTKNREDDILVKIAKKNGVKCFRGSKEDVLARFIGAADEEKAEIVVRVTGDNILVDPVYLDKMIKYHIKNKADYTRTEGLPSGVKCEVMSVAALKKTRKLAERPENSEYMTWYFTKNPEFFKIATMPVPEKYSRLRYRLTIDEPNDYKLLKIIFKKLYKKGEKPFLWPEIVEFLDKNPKLLEINAKVAHKDFARMKKEINIKLKKKQYA